MKFAVHFPGQGSQSLGMLSDLAEQFSIVEAIFARASEVLDYDLWSLTQEGPEEKLNQTEFTQPAMLAADFATWECWKAVGGPDPQLLAGHSLGEYVAYTVAETMTLEEAIAAVAMRGRLMQSAVSKGDGAMAAIIGLNEKEVSAVCDESAHGEVVSPANFNSIGQTVIAGQTAAVDRAIVLAKEKGAKIAKRIPVSIPSHCALMEPITAQFAKKLQSINLQRPKIPVISNVDVNQHTDVNQIRKALVEQLVNPVHWVKTVLNMQEQGMKLFIECGPNKVLAGLNKRIVKTIPTQPINNPDSLATVVEWVKENT